jgi:mono/diheme cytochrome c family protein
MRRKLRKLSAMVSEQERIRGQRLLIVAGVAVAMAVVVAAAAFIAGLDRAEDRNESTVDRPAWQTAGEGLYQRQCRACHQADGSGMPRTFPPLAGHLPELLESEGARAYLIDLLLYGVSGEIEIQGVSYRGMMPGFGRLGDGELAALLNYTARAWGNEGALPEDFEDFTVEEVAGRRHQGLRPQQVYETRPD